MNIIQCLTKNIIPAGCNDFLKISHKHMLLTHTHTSNRAHLCPLSEAWCRGVYPELSEQFTFKPFHMLRREDTHSRSQYSTSQNSNPTSLLHSSLFSLLVIVKLAEYLFFATTYSTAPTPEQDTFVTDGEDNFGGKALQTVSKERCKRRRGATKKTRHDSNVTGTK